MFSNNVTLKCECSGFIHPAILSVKGYSTAALTSAAYLVSFQQYSSKIMTLAAWVAGDAPGLIAEPKLTLLSASLCYTGEM